MNELYTVSGCSGIGGLDCGFKSAGFRTICYIESDAYCQSVLCERMQEGGNGVPPTPKGDGYPA